MLVLIDGHNLIGKMPNIYLDEDYDEDKLILKLQQYRAKTGRNVKVFFDPGKTYKSSNKQTKGGITIHYAPFSYTADQLIIKHLQKAKNPCQIMVITSDRAIQKVAKSVRAIVKSSTDFASELSFQYTSNDYKLDEKLSEEEVEEWLKIFNKVQ